MGNFRTLDLAKDYYRKTRVLKLPVHLRDQYLRCCSSIALNLAEGNAKLSNKEKARFYEIAHGSFRESITILEIEDLLSPELAQLTDQLGASLYKLTRSFLK